MSDCSRWSTFSEKVIVVRAPSFAMKCACSFSFPLVTTIWSYLTKDGFEHDVLDDGMIGYVSLLSPSHPFASMLNLYSSSALVRAQSAIHVETCDEVVKSLLRCDRDCHWICLRLRIGIGAFIVARSWKLVERCSLFVGNLLRIHLNARQHWPRGKA